MTCVLGGMAGVEKIAIGYKMQIKHIRNKSNIKPYPAWFWKKLDQGALGMSNPLGPLQLALDLNLVFNNHLQIMMKRS